MDTKETDKFPDLIQYTLKWDKLTNEKTNKFLISVVISGIKIFKAE